ASMKYEKGSITFVDETVGKTLDIEENMKMIKERLLVRDFGELPLFVRDVTPRITTGKIKDVTKKVSVFETWFNAGDLGRTKNIELAAGKINGYILLPGDVFSMNEAIGPRTEENGYMDAPVILNGEIVEGIGGGVCQVTTTLYNAVL